MCKTLKLVNICYDKYGSIFQIKTLEPGTVQITLPDNTVFVGTGNNTTDAKEKLEAKIIRERFRNYKFKNE
jgi:hypothetical protein